MRTIAMILALVALAATIIPSCLFFAGAITHNAVQWIALIGTGVWFATAPLWLGAEKRVDETEVEI